MSEGPSADDPSITWEEWEEAEKELAEDPEDT